jgi:hypothetical protein
MYHVRSSDVIAFHFRVLVDYFKGPPEVTTYR